MKKRFFNTRHLPKACFLLLIVMLLLTISSAKAKYFRLPEISMKSSLPAYQDSIPMIIVWDPIGSSNASLLINTIQTMCPDSVYHTDNLLQCQLTEQVKAIFCLFGIYPNNYTCQDSSDEALAIESYLLNGGSVYIEGGDVWYWDPLYNNGHNFGPLFHIHGISEGTGDLDTVTGLVFLNGMSWTYQGYNNYIGHIEPYPDAYLIFEANNGAYGCGVAYSSGTYNTIGTSFQITGLTYPNYYFDDAMEGILSFFNLYTPKGTIRGKVTLDTLGIGNVTDVEISVDNQSVHPDPWGFYNISIFPGTYDVTASLSGYYAQTIEHVIVVADSITDSIDFYLQAIDTTTVSGMIICADAGNPYNTRITLQNDEFYYVTYVMDTTGYYTISDVYFGEYSATAYLDGYFVSYWNGTIDSINNVVDFTLTPTDPGGEIELHYDSENANSIGGPSSFQCAVRFTPEELYPYYGEYLSKVKFWISSAGKLTVYIRVWEGGSIEEGPRTRIYNQNVSAINYDDWTIHELTNPITLEEGEEYWIGYYLSGSQNIFPAGCDNGPMKSEKGAWIYYNGQWQLLTDVNPDYDFNWNIRAIVKSQTGGFYLGKNWNWISFNVIPPDSSIDYVFAALADDILQVKNQTQSATNYGGGNWIGDLTNISIGEGYLVKMDTSATFSVNGMPIDYQNTPIILTQDWNWIAYLPPVATDLSTALTCIEENAYQIKNQTQSATYIDPPGVWIGNLITMEPGVGYKLKMTTVDTLIYQIGGGKGDKYIDFNPIRQLPYAQLINWQVISGTEYNMVVMAELEVRNYELRVPNYELGMTNCVRHLTDYELGVFDDDGNCRSIGVRQNVNGKEFWYFTIVGNESAESKKELHFCIYNQEMDEFYECNESILFADNTTVGSPEEPFFITLCYPKTNTPKVYKLCQNYPNPFSAQGGSASGGNPITTIRYQLPEKAKVKITVYNILGQRVRTLVDAKKEAGCYSIIWDGKDDNNKPLASGIYFYKLQANSRNIVKKCILLK